MTDAKPKSLKDFKSKQAAPAAKPKRDTAATGKAVKQLMKGDW